MIEELFKNIESTIQQQVQDKFGLNSDQTTQSVNVLFDNFRNFFKDDVLKGNISNITGLLSNGIQGIKDNPKINNLKDNLFNDLQSKVGLPEDIASKLKDFQVNSLFDNIQKEFTDEQGNFDFQKIMQKIDMNDLQEKAKDIFGNLGNLFGGK